MVGSEVSVVRFDCDGNTNQYSFLFPITQSSQIKVYAYDTIDHYEALLVEDTHYEITPAIGGYKYGGTINIRSWNAETSSYDPYYFGENVRITIDRSPSVIQVSEYKNNEIVPKEQLESDMDLIYYHLQKLYNFFRHILRSSPSDPTDMVLPPAETRANHPFVFDNLGNPAVGDLIITPVSDYMSQFLQASIWADLESAGLFDNIVTYQTKKTGFTDPTTGFTTDATSQVIFLEVISSLRTVSLRWTDLWLLTSLDYYSIERSSLNSESGYEEIVRLGPGTTTYTDSPPMDFSGEYLLPTTFWYRVKAVNRAGELSPHSNVLEVLIEPITVADVDSNYVLDALQGTQGTGVLPSMAVLQSYNYIYRHLGFQITGTGNAEFNDVFLRGVIEAVAGGIIGGWTITDTGLEAGSELTRLVIDTEDGIYFGGETPDSAPFHVNRYGYAKFQDVFMRGVIEATSGIIGGWAITEAGLSAGLTTINADGSIVIGGNFSVSPEGLVTASDAVISGVISADSGLIGGWNITNSGLSSGSGGSKIVLDPQEGIWFGSENWETAPFAVNRNGFLKANFMELTAPLIQTSWNPTVNRIIFDQSGLRGYDGELGLTFELPTDGSAPRFSNGIIEYGTIRQTDIISDYFKTSETLPWVEMTRDGVGFRKSEPAGAYGTGPEYGDGTKYGVGVSAYFGNAAYPPLYIAQELSLADIRLYNRATNPTGPSVIGDIAVVDGVLKICTSPGTPGIYSEIRSDLGTASLVDTGTGAGEVPLNSDLGTASLVDTGTGAGDVPLNSDLPDFDQDLRTDDAVEFAFVTESDREVWGWSKRATTIASVGWYTIATTGSGRASTEFYIAEKRSASHQTIHFIAANHYGNGSVINVLSNSSFEVGGTVRYIRILGNGTYDGAAVQIYIDEDTTPIECYVRRDKQSPGWAPVNFATSITEGYVEKKRIDLGAVGNGMGATGDLSVSGKGSFATVDTGNGATEIFDMNQDLRSDDNVAFATVNTGQGANELYDMNQNVKTYSNVTFNNLTINGGMLPESSPYLGSMSVGSESYKTPSRGLYNSSWYYSYRGSIFGSMSDGGDGPYCGNDSTRVYNTDENYSRTWYYARF